MPTPEEWLEFFYPYLVDEDDPRFVPGADIDTALAVAADYRPTCLSADRQNQAQAHYAAYVVEFRRAQMQGGGGASTTATSATAGPIVEKAEGDVRVKYGTASSSSSTVSLAARNMNAGPSAPYAAWNSLWLVCNPTDTNTGGGGTGAETVRRGGIITRHGWPR